LFMVHIWVINEHASSHSRLKSFVQRGLQLPALLYITEDADKRGLQVQQIEQSALSHFAQNLLAVNTSEPSIDEPAEMHDADANAVVTARQDFKLEPAQTATLPPPASGEQNSLETMLADKGELEQLPPQARSKSAKLHEALSVRELQTLMLLGQGLSVSGIARNLALSVKTISTYRARALDKLHLTTTADLIRYAVEHLLIPGSDVTNTIDTIR